jgi:pyridoxamine 5'-phosphate oxidase
MAFDSTRTSNATLAGERFFPPFTIMKSAILDTEAPGPDPLRLFESWYAEATSAEAGPADAFALATVDANGQPAVRIVLFKGLVAGKLRFVTNLGSRKAKDLAGNPRAAVVFYWPKLGRQVRMEGLVSQATPAESDRYFASRDRESQLGAWASDQSRPIESRAALDARLDASRRQFEGRAVERPPHWGMLELSPERVELWLGGEHRLHDRFVYERTADGWRPQRLAP